MVGKEACTRLHARGIAGQMPNQEAVTIRASVRPGCLDQLRAVLSSINADVESNPLLPFGKMSGVHFARFVILDDAAVAGRIVPASLVFASNVDAPASAHLEELISHASGLDAVWQHCVGYPPLQGRSRPARQEFLESHMIASQAFYVNTVGRAVRQAREEAALRESLQVALDGMLTDRRETRRSQPEVAQLLRTRCRENPQLKAMLEPAEGLSDEWRDNEIATIVCAAAAALLAAPFLLVLSIPWLLSLRVLESRDARAEPLRLGLYRRGTLASAEDHVVQNQFSAVGCVKQHWLRRLTLRVLLAAADFATKHHFNKGDLGTVPLLGLNGVDTIHFAQWIVIDDGYRVLFLSNYDGSLTSYMDDFINKVAWGLNAVFSHGENYPATRWLVLDGATDEQAFKAFLQKHQIPTQSWYSGYKDSSALNLANSAAIRAGLANATEPNDWVARL
jgi:hypothetical protein